MGYVPDFERAKVSPRYFAEVYVDSMMTGNISFFDLACLNRMYEFEWREYIADDALVDMVIDAREKLDRAYSGALALLYHSFNTNDHLLRDLCIEVLDELLEEEDMINDWLEEA